MSRQKWSLSVDFLLEQGPVSAWHCLDLVRRQHFASAKPAELPGEARRRDLGL